MSEYVLGTSDAELARLEFQHRVWASTTCELLERAGLAPGMRVLDAGCGPGFVALEIAERVGPSGSIVALDASPRWTAHLERVVRERRIANVHARTAVIESAQLEPASFDLVFARWVLSFVPDLDGAVAKLARSMAPGGALVVQDYNHEGISLFPRSAGFDAVVRATRTLYAQAGGDAFVAARIPAACARAGLVVESIEPRAIAGGPSSDAFRWADLFFPPFAVTMEEKGLLTRDEHAAFEREWAERKSDPHALFFSPHVVGFVAR